ncbi:MAG: LysR family transcriptional regulator [Eubacterium sp.]|nr:LysR family transcriptional regulator [Eubacterium sp.]
MITDAMIKSFLTLARTLNFTNAAKEEYLTQQAVSKHIAKLEEALETPLFYRERGNIRLTDNGRIYHDLFSRYYSEFESTKLFIERISHKKDNVIRIGHLDLLNISEYFSPILNAFTRNYPDIQFIYQSSPDWELPTLLREHKVDCCITFMPEIFSPEKTVCFKIGQATEHLFVAKNHPLAKEDASYLDFKNENVFFSLPPSNNVKFLLERLSAFGFPFDNMIISENMASSCTSIEMGQGVSFAVLPCMLIDPKVFATYPTNTNVDIALTYLIDEERPLMLDFINIAKKVSG